VPRLERADRRSLFPDTQTSYLCRSGTRRAQRIRCSQPGRPLEIVIRAKAGVGSIPSSGWMARAARIRPSKEGPAELRGRWIWVWRRLVAVFTSEYSLRPARWLLERATRSDSRLERQGERSGGRGSGPGVEPRATSASRRGLCRITETQKCGGTLESVILLILLHSRVILTRWLRRVERKK